jgi:hypothetical protein
MAILCEYVCVLTLAICLNLNEVHTIHPHHSLDGACLLTCRLGKRARRTILLGIIDGTISLDWKDSSMSPGVGCFEDHSLSGLEFELADGLCICSACTNGILGRHYLGHCTQTHT